MTEPATAQEITITRVYEPAEGSWHEGSVSAVAFADLGGGRTEMVLRATVNTTEGMRVQAERGMRGTLDRLAGHLGR